MGVRTASFVYAKYPDDLVHLCVDDAGEAPLVFGPDEKEGLKAACARMAAKHPGAKIYVQEITAPDDPDFRHVDFRQYLRLHFRNNWPGRGRQA